MRTKTQQTIKQPSNIRPSNNTSTLIKKMAAATKQKLKEIRRKYLKDKDNKVIQSTILQSHHQHLNIIFSRDLQSQYPRLKINTTSIILVHLIPPLTMNLINPPHLQPMTTPITLHSL